LGSTGNKFILVNVIKPFGLEVSVSLNSVNQKECCSCLDFKLDSMDMTLLVEYSSPYFKICISNLFNLTFTELIKRFSYTNN
jgi:hypothetical protein